MPEPRQIDMAPLNRAYRWCVAHPYHLIGIAVLVIVGLNAIGTMCYSSDVVIWRKYHRPSNSSGPGEEFFFCCYELRYYLLLGCGVLAGLVALSRHGKRDD